MKSCLLKGHEGAEARVRTMCQLVLVYSDHIPMSFFFSCLVQLVRSSDEESEGETAALEAHPLVWCFSLCMCKSKEGGILCKVYGA